MFRFWLVVAHHHELENTGRTHIGRLTLYLNEYLSDVSYRDRCLTLGILLTLLCYRREISDLCFLFKYLHGEIDININTYLQFVQSNTSRRSANKGTLFYLNMTKTVQAQYMNFNRLARLWNKLPQHIRMSDSLGSFYRQLGVLYKSHLIDFDINNRCTWGIICCCSGCCVR